LKSKFNIQKMTSKIKYLGELRTEATHLQSGEKIITDAPVDNNGKGEAFSPTDLVATALGSCMMTVMNISARRDGMDFVGSEIEVTKIMATETPRRIAKIVLNITIVSEKELSEEQCAKFIRIAHTCPVALSLHPEIGQELNFFWKIK
jgi:putative redox protein